MLFAESIGIDPNAIVGHGTNLVALGCLIWVVKNTLGSAIPGMQKQHGEIVTAMQVSHATSMEVGRAQFLASIDIAAKNAADERKGMVETIKSLQKEYIQQIEFQRAQCTQEHVAKDRLLERFMERAGFQKTVVVDPGSGIIH